MNSDIEKLLVLQERDKSLFEIENALATFPAKRSLIEGKIREEEAALKESRERLGRAELDRADLRAQRRAKEEKADSMNGQRQTLMKKPAEYQALEHFIESLKKEAEAMEEKEIGLLYEIDELKEALEREKAERQKNLDLFQNEIRRLEEEKSAMEAKLDEARFKTREAEQGISPEYLQAYETLKKRVKRKPYLAKVEDDKCSGCHLRLSSEMLQAAKDAKEPVNCEMCGRLIYFE